MNTRREQLKYIEILGLDPEDVTNITEVEQAYKKLQEEAVKRNARISPRVEKEFKEGLYLITDLKLLKKTFNALAKETHPDHGGDPERFKEIFHAYKMLTDESFQVKETKQKTGAQQNLDAIFNLTVDFSQAFFGDQNTITFNPVHIDSQGKPVKINSEKDVHMELAVIRLQIPPGSTSGKEIRIQGKGLIEQERQGDLVVVLQVQPHPKFTIIGSDVISKETFPLDIMLTGGKVPVATMWGTVDLKVPPGTRPNDKIQVPNKGVSKVGHQYCIVEPVYPDQDELRHNSVWKKLGIKWEEDKDEFSEEEYEEVFERLSENGEEDSLS